MLSIAAPLPRCIPWSMAMIGAISPTAEPPFLKQRARPHPPALVYTRRGRTGSLARDRRVRPPMQCVLCEFDRHAVADANLDRAYLDVSGAWMRTESCVDSLPSRTPVGQERASGLCRAKPMFDNWAIPIKWASVAELHWKFAPCGSLLGAPRSQ